MSSIVTDEGTPGNFDAETAFLKKWEDAEEPSDDAEGATDQDDETEHDPESEADEEVIEEDEGSDEDPETDDTEETEGETKAETKARKIAEDDAEVVLTVDGEEVKASVKDLKRLYGQEASLTRKSQELAAVRKTVDEEASTYSTALQTLQKRAEDKYRPYTEIDYLVAAKQLEPEELKALRSEATAAYEDYKFLTEELTSTKAKAEEASQAAYQKAAQEAITVLADPEKGIPNWSQEVYNDIRKYAIETNGMPVEAMNKIVDPGLIKMMWKASRYDKAKKVSTKKLATTPKRVLKSNVPSDQKMKKDPGAKATKKLQDSGHRDDAAAALLARWEVND